MSTSSLQEEITKARSEIKTDAYPMSIGEFTNLYNDGELDIHPEFQRFFRWTDFQKSRFIESLLLGIPVPPIFVAQNDKGIWDVVDGLQRLSTILEFLGILRDEEDNVKPALTLQATKYLPSLNGKRWDDPEEPDRSLDPAQRLYIKRAKLDVSIILRESDEKAKYELFQRLNTGGSPLSEQEVRNCIIVMMDRTFYPWLRNFAGLESFKNTVALTDRAISEQYDMELALRFLILRTMSQERLSKVNDVNEFLTDEMVALLTQQDIDRELRSGSVPSHF